MKRYQDAKTYDNSTPAVVTIGTFDGVHVGHKKIIEQLIASSKQDGLDAVVLTFFPHPRMVLQQDSDIKLINTIEERAQLLEETGISSLVIHPFTQQFSRLTAQEYVEQMLIQNLNVRHVIIGYDHRFGRNRNSSITDLASYGIQNNFTVQEISKQDIDNVAISSTKIREALLQGDMARANTYLGYDFMLTGRVIGGKELGRKLNYPTANLYIEEEYKLIPKNGVYIVKSLIENKLYFGMMNIGTNPTVNGTNRTIETHLKIQIKVLMRIRDEKKFNSIEELTTAMQQDEDFARDYINSLL